MDAAMEHIVVGIAEPGEESTSISAALQVAAAAKAMLHVVVAFESDAHALDPYVKAGYSADADPAALYAQGLVARLESQVQRLTQQAERVRCHALQGPADQVLTEAAERLGAGLLLVGSTRRDQLRAVLGTTAQRVLRNSSVPVMVLRRPLLLPLHRVLLATDCSPAGVTVLGRGMAVVRALSPESMPTIRALSVDPYDFANDEIGGTTLKSAQTRLDRFLDQCRTAGYEPEGKVRSGSAAAEIEHEAAEWPADLVVLGTHGQSGIARAVLGSVAEHVLLHARGNTLVIPNRTQEQNAGTGDDS